jgi:protein-tyrosine phosphatase
VIDMHCHLLPGIDDGPATIEETIVLARASAASGVKTIVATPHVNSRTPNESQAIARLVTEVAAALQADGIEIAVLPGAEVAITSVSELEPGEIARLTLGGGEWLLLEPPFTPVAPGIEGAVLGLRREGYKILLAHPERCPALHREPAMLRRLADDGVLMSITAGSLVGRFGGEVKRFTEQLISEELIHNVASDAHDVARRAPGITDELERAGLSALRGWLTEEVPTAILGGGEIPPAPAFPRPRPKPRGLLGGWARRD